MSIISDFDIPFFYIITGFQNPSYFHAGITHTLVFGILSSVIISLIIFLLKRRKDESIKVNQLFHFILCAILGILLHLIMDLFTTANEYAIFHHIYFWPVWNFSFHIGYILPLPDNVIWSIQLIVNFSIVGVLLYDYLSAEKRPWNLFIKMDENAKISILDKVMIILVVIFYIYWQVSLFLRIIGLESFDLVAFFVGILT